VTKRTKPNLNDRRRQISDLKMTQKFKTWRMGTTEGQRILQEGNRGRFGQGVHGGRLTKTGAKTALFDHGLGYLTLKKKYGGARNKRGRKRVKCLVVRSTRLGKPREN